MEPWRVRAGTKGIFALGRIPQIRPSQTFHITGQNEPAMMIHYIVLKLTSNQQVQLLQRNNGKQNQSPLSLVKKNTARTAINWVVYVRAAARAHTHTHTHTHTRARAHTQTDRRDLYGMVWFIL